YFQQIPPALLSFLLTNPTLFTGSRSFFAQRYDFVSNRISFRQQSDEESSLDEKKRQDTQSCNRLVQFFVEQNRCVTAKRNHDERWQRDEPAEVNVSKNCQDNPGQWKQ